MWGRVAKYLIGALLLLAAVGPPAWAQQPVITYPAGWSPSGLTVSLAATTSTASVKLGWVALSPQPNPPPASAIVCNTGTVTANVVFGNSSVVATTGGFPVSVGACPLMALNGATYIAGITASGSTTLSISAGNGSASNGNGVGSGGGLGVFMTMAGDNATAGAAQQILTNSGAAPLTVGGAFKIGGASGVGISYTNNELVLDANKSFAVSGTGSFQVNQSLGGPLISSDSNDTVTITSVSPQANTNLVVQPGIAGGTVFMGVNAQSGTNEERLVIGSQGHGTHYLFGQVVLGTGSCQPVDFLNGASAVAFTLTCTPNLRLPNATPMVGRNAANSADLAILNLNASNQVELGFGAVTTLFPSLISSASSQVQIGESGGNGVLNINGQGVSSAAYNFLSSAGDLFINRGTGKTIHFRENNGADQLSIAPTTGVVSFAAAPTLSTITGSTQCLQVNTSGIVAGSGASCGGSLTVGTTTIASGTTNGLLYNNAGVLGNLASANSGILITSGAGVPSISSTLPSGLAATNLALTTPSLLPTPTAGDAICYIAGAIADCGVAPVSIGTGLSLSGTTVNSSAVEHISYQPGLLTAVNSTKAVFHKYSKASTVDNLTGSAATFSCVSNPTITMYECGTSASCSSSPTTIGTVTLTAAGTVVDGAVSAPAIAAGDYVAFAMTAGTCASVDVAAIAQVHSN